jgi:hypothetical protein
VALIVMILAVMWFADHPALLARSRHQVVRLDRAIADEGELRGELERRLGGRVTSMTVQDLDFVNDTALVDVRYRLPQPTRGRLVAPLRTRAVQIASGEAR